MRRLQPGGVALLLAPLMVGPAEAHSPVPGMQGVIAGLMHPFSTPAQALVVIGLGLLGGGYAQSAERHAIAIFFPLAFVAGLALGQVVPNLDAALFATAVAALALVALAPGQVLALGLVIVGLGGLLIGIASLPDPGPFKDRLFTIFGTFLGAGVGLVYVMGLVVVIKERFAQAWVGIAFRVAAAWLGAIALVMLALGLSGAA